MGFKEIGKKIQQARESQGYSQEQLARMIGCSQSSLSNYEKGKRRLYLSQLEKIAEALKMPIDYFMESRSSTEENSMVNSEDKEAIRLLNEIYNLSFEERLSVWDYIGYIRWKRLRGGNQNG